MVLVARDKNRSQCHEFCESWQYIYIYIFCDIKLY